MSTLNIILYLLIASSMFGLVVIVYRKIPLLARLSDEEISILNRKKSIIQKIQEVDYKQHRLNFIIALEKFLRKIKIIFLKIENLLSKCIDFLRNHSQIMTQKSREWIKQREAKRNEIREDVEDKTKTDGSVLVEINKEEIDKEEKIESEILEDDDLPISELKKPIKEEQKWIDLIVEDPRNITAYKFLGLLYWKQHNYIDAKSSLEMATKLGCKDKKVKEALKEMRDSNLK